GTRGHDPLRRVRIPSFIVDFNFGGTSMNSSAMRGLVALAGGALLASAPLVAAAPAEASSGMLCRAHVQDATPSQYSYNRVYVTTKAHAAIRTVAHYKTTDTTKYAKA